MKGKRKKKSLRIKSSLKKGTILITLFFIAGGVFMNSGYISSRQDEVYAQMKSKYSMTVQEEPDVIEEKNEENVISNVSGKNLELTVDSDLRVASNVATEEIDIMLSGTLLHGLGSAFVRVEQEYGVNALYMMGLACVESAWGQSEFAVKRNNLYGWNAVDSNPRKATSFNSKEECTLYVASKLKANYLTEGGPYHEGFSARSIDVHYCTDKQHADKIVNVVSNLVKKLG